MVYSPGAPAFGNWQPDHWALVECSDRKNELSTTNIRTFECSSGRCARNICHRMLDRSMDRCMQQLHGPGHGTEKL
ncbi:protein FAM84A [Anopheles sinensis]|uniref:Protein FAM84A n=1 Tax=Anopheles sinensis TaxID=74873 RepID=A0A084WPW4_ANOSI|nr:protein FAM84A [Anopheles sinensis]